MRDANAMMLSRAAVNHSGRVKGSVAMTRILIIVGVALAASCGKSNDKGSGAQNAPTPSPGGIASAPAAPASATPSCDEDRYQKWLAMQKEMNAALGNGLQATSQRVDAAGKDTATAKGEAITGLAATGRDLQAIETKYGFDHKDQQRWASMMGSMTNLRPLENPMMKGMVESYRKMQAGSGAQKETADKFFDEQEKQGKKAETKARERYGDACVDLMVKHTAEIEEIQAAGAEAVLAPKKK